MFLTAILGSYYPARTDMAANKIDIFLAPKVYRFHRFGNWLYQKSVSTPVFRLLIWNALLPMLVLCFFWIRGACSGRWGMVIFTTFPLIQIPIMFLVAPVPNWRFFYFAYLAFFVVIPLYFWERQKGVI